MTFHMKLTNIKRYTIHAIGNVTVHITLAWQIIKPVSKLGPQSSLSLSINCCVSLSVSWNPVADFPWLFVGRSDGRGGGGCWGGGWGEDGSDEVERSVNEILDGAAEADKEALLSGKLSYIGFAKSVGLEAALGLYSRSSAAGLSWKMRMPHQHNF